MINTVDKSGEPRSVEELKETLDAVKNSIIKFDSSALLIHATVILEALNELIAIREFLANKRAAQQGLAQPTRLRGSPADEESNQSAGG